MDKEYLFHHGIKGQRWGIRRYQNDDGTLTNAGKERYGIESEKDLKKSKVYKIDRKEAMKEASKEKKQLVKDVGKKEAERLIKEKYGPITMKDLQNKKLRKNIATGAGITAGVGTAAVATAVAVPTVGLYLFIDTLSKLSG